VLYDFHKMGGVPVVMKIIESHLNLECPTVSGKSVGENLAGVTPRVSDVIRSLDNPVWPEGALAILKGNLAPRGAVTRHTVVENKELLKYSYTARVFEALEDVLEAIHGNTVNPGEALVCRNQGPRGGPAMTECLSIIWALKARNVKDVAVITDGRFSGWTKGYLAIGNVCPESQVGGPLALVREGDKIRVDVHERILDLEISAEEMAYRRAERTPPDQSRVTGALLLYAMTALQADQGAGWPVRWSDVDGK
jgi:dihydroxy-acid dehydratase